MGLSNERTGVRAVAVVAAMVAALGLVLLAAAPGQAGKGANKTYGLTSKAKKNGTVQNLGHKKPSSATYKSSFDIYKASKIGRWKGWGNDEASANARSVRLCDLEGKKKTDCTSAKGTLTFSDPVNRRCNKGGKKKKVRLYTTTTFEHGPTGGFPNGRGAAVQYGVLGKPDCPKF